ncbi:replicative DNA helicase [Abyssicoccus albus]|uniref:Replicative DNA helicase n=1 Tax=Abyssicoccus albus TaxID=1817405 RepID=A0A3N5BG72_9BACL|nr:replicative DNA helicase [Abyssicoccus albus]RPF56726.1 primary replicative DNA helicase [Abyssicoccus albus]
MFEQNQHIPFSIDAEKSVLGAILIDPEHGLQRAQNLLPQDFYYQNHQHIFESMLKLYDKNEQVDTTTLVNALTKEGVLQDIGGPLYIAELAQFVPTSRNIDYYIEIVENYSLKRQLIYAAQDIARDGMNEEIDLDDLLSEAEKMISSIGQGRGSEGFKDINSVMHEVYEMIEQRTRSNGETTGIPSGYASLDRMTSGFGKNDLIILAARPSVGKTAFALNIAQNIALNKQDDYSVAVFSLEMGADQLATRMVCSVANLDSNKLRTGQFDQSDWDRFIFAIGELGKSKMFIDDTPGIKINDIRAKSRALKQEHGLDMIIIDYLQLIQGSGLRKGENRQQEVSEISRTLKEIARELEVPVIALSQLSRGVEQRQDKRPMLSDIRESGSIEQDADIVAFLYRDDYYQREAEDEDGNVSQNDQEDNGIVEVILAKHRNGPTGTVPLIFVKKHNKFNSIDERYAEQYMG